MRRRRSAETPESPQPAPAPAPAEAAARRQRRRLIRLLIGGLAATALLLAWLILPGVGLRWGVVEVLRRAGMAEVSLGAGELSLFGKRIVIQGMAAGPKEGQRLRLDDLNLLFHWRPLFDRRISMETVALKGLAIAVRHEDGRYIVNGLPLTAPGGAPPAPDTPPPKEERPWLFGVETFSLGDSVLSFTDGPAQAELAIDSLMVEGLRLWDPDTPSRFHLSGKLNGAPITVDGTGTPFAAQPRLDLHVVTQGLDLVGGGLVERLGGVTGLAGKADADLTVAAQLPAGQVSAQGKLTLHGLSWQAADQRLNAGSLAWSGNAAFAGGGAGKGGGGLDGRIEAQELRLALGELEIAQRHLAVQGKLDLAAAGAGGADALPVRGRLQGLAIDGLAVGAPQSGQDWLAADRLQAAALVLAPGQPVGVEGLVLNGVSALQKRTDPGAYPWRLQVREARADRLMATPAGAIGLGELRLDGAVMRLQRTAQGLTGLTKGASGGSGGATPPIAIGKLVIGNQSRLLFEDRTLAEPVRLRLDLVEATVERLDSGKPEQDSPLALNGRLGGAPVELRGSLRPFAAALRGEVKGTVRGLELPALSGYAAAALGVHVQTGHLDAEMAAGVRDNRLDGKMTLTLAKLLIAQPDPNTPLARKTNLPIETVLDLLRDRDGVIHLDIPVSGALDAPDIDVSDAVNQAVAGALKATAATTLQVLFPVAALISLVDDDGGKHLALAPLAFEPGQDSLSAAQHDKLSGIAKLLRERPGLKLTLCGVASAEQDWPPLAERQRKEQAGVLSKLQGMLGVAPEALPPPDQAVLTRLAERRGQLARGSLADDFGIDPSRLFSCRGSVETAPGKGGPRVDLLL